ncbi:MAG: SIR2 family protein [Mycobacteriaceae bacterium]|nr:SIR2 family protein [Mycobacteriaceae bacterium]
MRLVVTADGLDNPEWVADGVVEAIETFTRDLPTVAGRVKPLIALPLVGTGEGGFIHKRGLLIKTLLPRLHEVAIAADVDVALVLRDDRDHVAIQGQRSAEDWQDFDSRHLELADDLGARAARGELSLFLGSGVSVPLGLPDWHDLLEDIAGEPLTNYSAEKAPGIAQALSDELGTDSFHGLVAERLQVSGYAPAHMLLAALDVQQTVTTNYDVAYELALSAVRGTNAYQVLARQPAIQPRPWVLKLHGDVRMPESVVITTDDYARLAKDHGPLVGLVESLLMTSHLMFVGFSMGDPDFDEAAKRVSQVRALAEEIPDAHLATVLALGPESVVQRPEFATVAMSYGDSHGEAARKLEIFIDRVSWAAARHRSRSNSYLLDDDYADLFVHDITATALRRALENLVALPVDHQARRNAGWARVEAMLTELGAKPTHAS